MSQLDFYEMLASYKLAIILEGIHARYLMGKTVGEGFDHIGMMVETIANSALDAAVALRDRRAARLTSVRVSRLRVGHARLGSHLILGDRHPAHHELGHDRRDETGHDEPGPARRLRDEHDRRERHAVARAEERGDPDHEEERVGAADRDAERAAEQRARDHERNEEPADAAARDGRARREAAQHAAPRAAAPTARFGASAQVTTP